MINLIFLLWQMPTNARSAASAGNVIYPATMNLSASIRVTPVAAGMSYASKRRASTCLAFVVGEREIRITDRCIAASFHTFIAFSLTLLFFCTLFCLHVHFVMFLLFFFSNTFTKNQYVFSLQNTSCLQLVLIFRQ